MPTFLNGAKDGSKKNTQVSDGNVSYLVTYLYYIQNPRLKLHFP